MNKNDDVDLFDCQWQNLISGQMEQIKNKMADLSKHLVGRKVRIIGNYNGQPWGTSRPSLKGKEFEIASICLSDWQTASLCLFLKGERVSIRPNNVEFL